MKLTRNVQKILAHYESDSPGTKANLARFFMSGKLGGTGKMIILPVDQGFEHGPARSFGMNPDAFDPVYHHQMAVEAGLNGYAAPLGMLEASSDQFAGAIPTILKINSSNSLKRGSQGPDQAVTGSVKEALRLGCSAIGFTIYPGSDQIFDMLEELRDLTAEAKAHGLAVIVWSYARGGDLQKDDELALDIISYGAHMACLMGAHIVKVKLPSAHLATPQAQKIFAEQKIPTATQADRVRHVVQSCFNGRRMVIFSGGEAKTIKDVLDDARAIRDGGGQGSIIGRNCFQRPRAEGMQLLADMIDVFKGK